MTHPTSRRIGTVVALSMTLFGAEHLAAAAATTQPETTRPASEPAPEYFPAVPAERSAPVKIKLRSAVEESQRQLRGNLDAAARKRLALKISEAIAVIGDESDPALTLRRALADVSAMRDDREAVDRLQGAIAEAILAMDYKPTMEAPLPEGFPSPGPIGRAIVKAYPGYRLARTPMSGGDQNKPFWTLFKHIEANQIAMTAPVEMTYTAANQKVAARDMAFLYRSTKQGNVGQQGAVEVVDVPAMTVVSVGIRGSYTDERMATAMATLNRWLADNAATYEPAGDARYLGYNSPFVLPWVRYGEVQIPIRRK
ncbi:heme-binding protein [Humisphaera borealis]|uniref:Heme-binding protein n=1 Tax=Humisphaera borealis TaxID=2807512 RepID=A0A7M2WST2_9BACT|nr:heme-binding protein [Humisphaera borealis]QOV88557.1 heme-binding protein [Humisphaera borealis]